MWLGSSLETFLFQILTLNIANFSTKGGTRRQEKSHDDEGRQSDVDRSKGKERKVQNGSVGTESFETHTIIMVVIVIVVVVAVVVVVTGAFKKVSRRTA